jgi:hypothetical protein
MLDLAKLQHSKRRRKRKKRTATVSERDLLKDSMEAFDSFPQELRDAVNYSLKGWTHQSIHNLENLVRTFGPSTVAAMIKRGSHEIG